MMFWLEVLKNVFTFLRSKKEIGLAVVDELEKTVKNIKENNTVKKQEVITQIDYSIYPDENYYDGYDPSKKTILLVDDLTATKILYEIGFSEIKRVYKVDVIKDYNIVMLFGKNVGFTAMKFIQKDVKIDFAILDITIDTLAKFGDDFVELDGVDLAIELHKKDKSTKIMFSSAHTMNPRNLTVLEFIEKFKKYFKDDMYKHTVDKSVDRHEAIYSFLNGGLRAKH